MFEDIFNSYSITNTLTGVNLTHFRSILTTQPKSSINLSIRAYIPVTHASLSKLFVPSARIARGTMLSCTCVCVNRVSLVFFRQRPLSSNVPLIFVSREGMATFHYNRSKCCSTTLGSSQFEYRINLSYFPSRARHNFRWIFKEFDLKRNVRGFFVNFLA